MALLDRVNPYVLIAIGLLIAFIFVFRAPRIRRNGEPLSKPPNTLPLFGNGILFLRARQELFSWFVKCERQFGYETFQITVPSLPPGVVINDPKNLEFVFKNEGAFGKGDLFKRCSWDLFGNGIITVDGELWKLQRKTGLSFLNTANLRVLTDVALPKYLNQSVDYLKAHAGSESVDMQVILLEITSQLMGKMAYNMEMHADDDFTLAFDHASGATAERFQNPLWFITEVFLGSQFRKSLSTVKSFGKKIVTSAMTDRLDHKAKSSGSRSADDQLEDVSGTLIQSFLDTMGNETLVADAALNYLSAGRDTVAQAMTWAIYLVMRHDLVALKIRHEVEATLKSKGGVTDATNTLDPTLFTPTAMPYTMAVFYESLRLYPPIPLEIKQSEKDVTLPDGTYLPAKSVVVWCIWAMNRSHITWGQDADAFRPERWLHEGKLVMKSQSEFPVFNGGVRTCLGKRMAEGIAVQVLATMMWHFDFKLTNDANRTSKSSLTLPMEGGLPCYIRDRSMSDG